MEISNLEYYSSKDAFNEVTVVNTQIIKKYFYSVINCWSNLLFPS